MDINPDSKGKPLTQNFTKITMEEVRAHAQLTKIGVQEKHRTQKCSSNA
jgi:hypothetical protein